jgi:hypothetical protein
VGIHAIHRKPKRNARTNTVPIGATLMIIKEDLSDLKFTEP